MRDFGFEESDTELLEKQIFGRNHLENLFQFSHQTIDVPSLNMSERSMPHHDHETGPFHQTQDSWNLYGTIIENMNEGLMVVDNDDVVWYVNERLCQMLGYNDDELIGKVGYELLFDPEWQEVIKEKNALRLQGISDRYEVELIAKSGERIRVLISGSPYTDRSGIVVGSVGVFTNLSREKEIEGLLADSQQYAQSIVDSSLDMIIAVNPDRRIIEFNRSAQAVFGYTRDEIIGKHVSILYADHEEEARITEALRQTGSCRCEVVNRKKTGETFTCYISAAYMHDSHGRVIGCMGVSRDITAQKELERRLLQTQRLECMGTLAGGIAHDLNNVFTPLTHYIDFLKEDSSDPVVHDYADKMKRSVQRGENLAKQITTFASGRGIQDKQTAIPMEPILQDALSLILETFPETIKIHYDCEKNLSLIKGNPVQLHQVIMNLCVNARDAMNQEGTLTIYAERYVHRKSMENGLKFEPGEYVLVTVSDSGTGISPEVIGRIFDPFFTTKEKDKGTGLGLSIVYRVIQNHGGHIDVKSVVGKGTVFSIYLPAKAE